MSEGHLQPSNFDFRGRLPDPLLFRGFACTGFVCLPDMGLFWVPEPLLG